MQEKELKYYERLGNWSFDKIKCTTEKLTDWDFYTKIKEHTNVNSVCLDLGTGGGEKVLKYYPKVRLIIGTDFSKEMVKTAKNNAKDCEGIKFTQMDNLEMKFPNEILDLVSARHTIINAKQIYNCLETGGALVIEGIDKNDCLEIKEIFGRGQGYNDEIPISKIDYKNVKEAGFSKVEIFEILEDEYYETKEDLMALILKTPILDDFSEKDKIIENDLFEKYVSKYKTEKGILLKRRLYGIVAKK